jgi:hypothetical protein
MEKHSLNVIIDKLSCFVPSEPRQLQRFHGWLTVVWIIMIPISIVTGWLWSLAFVSAASIYANFASHFASWQAARTEVKQDQMRDEGSGY